MDDRPEGALSRGTRRERKPASLSNVRLDGDTRKAWAQSVGTAGSRRVDRVEVGSSPQDSACARSSAGRVDLLCVALGGRAERWQVGNVVAVAVPGDREQVSPPGRCGLRVLRRGAESCGPALPVAEGCVEERDGPGLD